MHLHHFLRVIPAHDAEVIVALTLGSRHDKNPGENSGNEDENNHLQSPTGAFTGRGLTRFIQRLPAEFYVAGEGFGFEARHGGWDWALELVVGEVEGFDVLFEFGDGAGELVVLEMELGEVAEGG